MGEKFTLQIKSDGWCGSQGYKEQLNYVQHKFKQYLLVTYVTSESEVQKSGFYILVDYKLADDSRH